MQVSGEQVAAPADGFSLLIKPASADCNLRCEYCFYLGKCALYPGAARHRMSDAVLEATIRSYLATDQANYSFGWQGGEPTLMGLEFFRRVTDLQSRHGRAGSRVSNGLQTNGTLITDELARHLAEYRFLAGVSLDGPPEVHDRRRRYAHGGGSHADVMRGIGRLRASGVEFNILTLVSQSNVGQGAAIYRYLRDSGFLFHQYIECVEFDGAGRLQPYAVGGAAWGDFLCAVFDEWIRADTRRVSVRLFDSIVTMLVDGVANVCGMARDCRSYFVVEYNGDVYPCDFHVQPERRLGNVTEGTWDGFRQSPAYAAFGRRKAAWEAACATCPYLRLCAGDCPKNRRPGPDGARRLSELCAGWKRFYAHALPSFERLAHDVRRERAAADVRIAGAIPSGAGRNDPCPCGSGRKYKKCCGRG